MRFVFTIIVLVLSGCAGTPMTNEFKKGDVVIAQHFTRHPHYNGTHVTVSGDFGWRWVKEAHTLQVYEVTTVDGEKLAAQHFQLQRVTAGK